MRIMSPHRIVSTGSRDENLSRHVASGIMIENTEEDIIPVRMHGTNSPLGTAMP
jgi:hypothetical protein